MDFLLLNLILIAILFWFDPDFQTKRRFVILLANVAMIPTANLYLKTYQNRTMHMQQRLIKILYGVFLQQIIFIALMSLFRLAWAPETFYLEFFVSSIILFPLINILTSNILRRVRRAGRNYRKVVIVGTGITALRLKRNLTNDNSYGVKVLGFFGHPQDGFTENYLGNIDKLDAFIKKHHIDDIYCAGSTINEDDINHTIKIADNNFVTFYYVPPLSHFIKRNFTLTPVNSSIPALTLHSTRLHSTSMRALKRAFDIIFSLSVLGCAPLILPIIAIAIKRSSPGPVFFTQIRTGYRGRDFKCYKFRTMKVNADSDSKQASKDDDRKTRVGNFLRHTSIDELPQFWNVLKGDMSVVGPRPHMLSQTKEYRRLIDQYMVRHLVKPGITGWAQITGSRGATDELWQMEERVDKDVWYIEHWSFMLDIKIVVRTVTNALHGEENAY